MSVPAGGATGTTTGAATTTTAPAGGAPATSGAPAAASAPAGGGAAWHAGFTDPTLAAHGSVKKFSNAEAMAKGYIELEKKLGGSLTRPGPNASREEWERTWNALGRPEKPEDYKLQAPKMPEGVQFDAKELDGFDGFAHNIGLSRWQAQQLVNWYGGKRATQPGRSPAATEKALKGVWGSSYEHHMDLAKRAVAHLGGENLVTALRESGAGSHPAIVQFLAKVGAFLAEDNVISGDTAAQTSAKAEYETLMRPGSPYFDGRHADHKKAVARIQQLMPLVFPGKVAA